MMDAGCSDCVRFGPSDLQKICSVVHPLERTGKVSFAQLGFHSVLGVLLPEFDVLIHGAVGMESSRWVVGRRAEILRPKRRASRNLVWSRARAWQLGSIVLVGGCCL